MIAQPSLRRLRKVANHHNSPASFPKRINLSNSVTKIEGGDGFRQVFALPGIMTAVATERLLGVSIQGGELAAQPGKKGSAVFGLMTVTIEEAAIVNSVFSLSNIPGTAYTSTEAGGPLHKSSGRV